MRRVEERALLVHLGYRCLHLIGLALLQGNGMLLHLYGLHVRGARACVSANGVNRDAISYHDFLSVLDLVRRNIILVIMVRLQILPGVDTGLRCLVVSNFLERMELLSLINGYSFMYMYVFCVHLSLYFSGSFKS